MAHRQSYKEEPGVAGPGDHHLPHHAQQGPPPHQIHRPSSIVQQQHHQQAPPPPQHPSVYPPPHGVSQYAQPGASGPAGQQQHSQDLPYYSNSHPSQYPTPGASSTYSSAEPDVMAAAQMSSRPQQQYPPIYNTPQSNSPASQASPSGHEPHRGMYNALPSQMHQQQTQNMYYGQATNQYPPMPAQQATAPYAQHPQHQAQQQQQQQQHMTSQPNALMSHAPGPHQMQQHASQHQQPGMTGSPRPKMEPHNPQINRPAQPLGPQQHPSNVPQMQQNNMPGGPGGNGANPNAAPGPIPATTPLVVRQDNNGVQWIAFEYSRDRVKMEYTIRCDVESVNVETLSPEFKNENCVYPRACCSKDQYRGNRLVYESECNTVGWALAELNPCLRGKRGLIQRAVDSWRNSNQDPRLRSRRVRRMAKINNRKTVQSATHNPHMGPPGPGGPAGIPPSGSMGPGGAGNMGKPSMGGIGGQQLHHHHQNHPDGAPGGDDVDGDDYNDEHTHHHHQAPNGPSSTSPDVRQNHAFPGYSGGYPPNPSSGGASMAPTIHDARAPHSHGSAIAARSKSEEDDRTSLFGDIPEGKKRKFILVDDPQKGQRVRVRVTLDTVDINEIPDSFRKSNSVYPRSWFPMQMQSPPPSAHGSRFFESDDMDDQEDDGRSRRGRNMVKIALADGQEVDIPTPRMRKSMRTKEVKINELGYRMTWHQSRVFADKTVFLQKALDSYRNKMKASLESTGQDATIKTPHFETRVGKRRWTERSKRERKEIDA